jgi:hypothetical protein
MRSVTCAGKTGHLSFGVSAEVLSECVNIKFIKKLAKARTL